MSKKVFRACCMGFIITGMLILHATKPTKTNKGED